MKKLQLLLLILCVLLNVGCNSTLDVLVYDSETKEAIPEAYIYVSEFAMFSPFNTSNIYLTDKDGKATIRQNIQEGNIHIFAGKDEYRLSRYNGKLYGLSSIDIFLNPKPNTGKFRIRQVQIPAKLLNQYKDNPKLRNFINYCEKENIEILKVKK